MAERIFGTDGVRGVYGQSEHMNPNAIERMSYAFAQQVRERDKNKLIVVGGDTRTSTPALLDASSTGLAKAGMEVLRVETAPTPVIAWYAKQLGASAIAITASHNPARYNGFKPFLVGGRKPGDEFLQELEGRYSELNRIAYGLVSDQAGQTHDARGLESMYLNALAKEFGADALEHQRVVIDGANGAAYALGRKVFEALGAEVDMIGDRPSRNINDGVGAADLRGLKDRLRLHEWRGYRNFLGGFAFDGDADRVMAVDHTGREVNGNHWMTEFARDGDSGVVGTLYTNSGTRQAIEATGARFVESGNGDSKVTQALLEHGLRRGGEFTGHMIDLKYLPSGDGVYMGAWLAARLASGEQRLADIYEGLKLWPESMRRIELPDGVDVQTVLASDAVLRVKQERAQKYGGRFVLRASGTEPVIRVWAEAEEPGAANEMADALAAEITQHIERAA